MQMKGFVGIDGMAVLKCCYGEGEGKWIAERRKEME